MIKDFLYVEAMAGNLAHLNALHAVEVSARLGSFTRAAEELGVTPAAVGQQVRILEDFLGRKVFDRTPDGLRATAAASSALAELHGGFDRLEAGFNRLVGSSAGNRLSVSVAPTLAWKWLAPRIQGLYERCPEIDLRMDASLRLVDIAGGEFDLVIRYGKEERGELESDLLFEEYTLPVCAPGLCDFADDAPGEERLLSLPLLHIEGESSDAGVPDWRDWGARYDIDDELLDMGPRYPQTGMAIQAAVNGQGVALCNLTAVIDDLVAGRLVAPLGPGGMVKTHYDYRIVHSPGRHQSAIHTIFVRWIKSEASKTRAIIAGFQSGA